MLYVVCRHSLHPFLMETINDLCVSEIAEIGAGKSSI